MSPEQQAGALVGMLIGVVFGLTIGSLVGAIILRAAASWAEKIDIPFGAAFVTVLLSTLASAGIGMFAGFIYGASGAGKVHGMWPLQIVVAPIGFLIQAGVISARHNLTFGKGVKISLFMLLIGILIGVVIGVVAVGVGILFGLMGRR